MSLYFILFIWSSTYANRSRRQYLTTFDKKDENHKNYIIHCLTTHVRVRPVCNLWSTTSYIKGWFRSPRCRINVLSILVPNYSTYIFTETTSNKNGIKISVLSAIILLNTRSLRSANPTWNAKTPRHTLVGVVTVRIVTQIRHSTSTFTLSSTTGSISFTIWTIL